jgi:apolipoprotein N-acyltransferase
VTPRPEAPAPARWLAARGRWLVLPAGAALTLSFAPFGYWWLAPPLLALLFLATDGQSRAERFRRGFWFGVGQFATGTYWVYVSIHDYGGAAPPFAVAAVLALVLVMALYPALAALLGAFLPRAGTFQRLVLGLPACWTVAEWLRGWLFTGFPWLTVGYGQIDGPLGAFAPVAGVHGVSLVTAVAGGALAAAVAASLRARLVALALVAGLAVGGLGLARVEWGRAAGPALQVALVQGGIGQERKWQPEEREGTLALYRDLTVGLGDVDLAVWPEAAVPALAHEESLYLTAISELGKARGMQVLLGVVTFDFDTGQFHNSLLSVGPDEGLYHKRHLVPFGEFFPVPAFVRDVLRLMNLPYQDITPGRRRQPLLTAGGVAIGPSICYEDVFGAEVRDFLPAAGLLVNVSNDGWFGDSIAPHQHLQMARMRALEGGRYLLRSTNTGISAVIDPAGRVVARGPQFEPAVVTATITPQAGATPWVRFGNALALGLCLVMVLGLLLHGRAPHA